MDYKTIIFTKSDKIGTITFNRPEKRNAINVIMGNEMVDCLQRCEDDPDVRAVILTGSGSVFCAGGDLVETQNLADSWPLCIKKLLNAALPAVSELLRLGVPVIAAVNGPAVGGGFSLALACDLIIAAKRAKFSSHYVLIAQNPDVGLTYMLPRVVGLKRATWLMFTGEVVDAQKGYEMGFVNQVVEDSELLNEANALARRFAEGATLAIAQTKKLIYSGLNESFETQMENEKQSMAHLASTEDAGEAVIAFREKRRPRFKGC